MEQYASRLTLTKDGKDVADFISFKENTRTVRAQVNLMKKTGFIERTVRHTFEVEYVIPLKGRIDWEGFKGGTFISEDEGGNRITFTGVATLDVGEATYDGENPAKQTITMGAATRIEE
jgi:hypothetical protein